MGRKKKVLAEEDSIEQITKCLNCKLPECIDCITYGTSESKRRSGRAPVVLTDRDGKVLAFCRSRGQAVERSGLTPSTLSRAICYGIFWRGAYLWRDVNKIEDTAIPCLRCEKAECDNCRNWDYQPPEVHLPRAITPPPT